jgi:hypothetical protein
MKKRIIHIRKQSRIETPNENLWFFSDDGAAKQSSSFKKKPTENDHLNILNDDYNRYANRNSGRNTEKEDCPFVVDWQLTDTF